MKNNKKWFSIIEIIIWMFIFSLWIISVYAVISSSVRINDHNRHYIIASNLAREQLEILRNNRDYNYAKIQKFDQINPLDSMNPDFSNVLDAGIYKVENNFEASSSFPLNIEKISDNMNLSEEIMQNSNISLRDEYRVYFDETQRIYTFDDNGWSNTKTPYIKYVEISRDETNQILISSRVIWESRGRHDFEIKTILTDWKQL